MLTEIRLFAIVYCYGRFLALSIKCEKVRRLLRREVVVKYNIVEYIKF